MQESIPTAGAGFRRARPVDLVRPRKVDRRTRSMLEFAVKATLLVMQPDEDEARVLRSRVHRFLQSRFRRRAPRDRAIAI